MRELELEEIFQQYSDTSSNLDTSLPTDTKWLKITNKVIVVLVRGHIDL